MKDLKGQMVEQQNIFQEKFDRLYEQQMQAKIRKEEAEREL